MNQVQKMAGSFSRALSRREFVAVSGAALAAAPAFAQQPQPPAGPKIKVGVVGCGGRDPRLRAGGELCTSAGFRACAARAVV